MKSTYFNFSDFEKKIEKINLSDFKGWSGLEILKLNLPKEKIFTSSFIQDHFQHLDSKEMIFLITDGKLEINTEESNFIAKRFDIINFYNKQNFNFKSIDDSIFYLISSNNLKSINSNKKSKHLNLYNEVKSKNLWGGKIISRPYESQNFTLVLFELMDGFKFHDNGHANEQITWLIDGEMEFYSDNKKKLLKKNMGVSIGSHHEHGGISKGAMGLDIFYPKRIEDKYRTEN